MTDKTNLYLILLVIILTIFYSAFYIKKLRRFSARKKYFQMELDRSQPDDISFWKRKLTKEYLSIIPLLGDILVKIIK